MQDTTNTWDKPTLCYNNIGCSHQWIFIAAHLRCPVGKQRHSTMKNHFSTVRERENFEKNLALKGNPYDEGSIGLP